MRPNGVFAAPRLSVGGLLVRVHAVANGECTQLLPTAFFPFANGECIQLANIVFEHSFTSLK